VVAEPAGFVVTALVYAGGVGEQVESAALALA
jgi:hypothetical protein